MKPIDVFVLFTFIRRLVRPFKDWPAYKVGLIDEFGNYIVPAEKRTAEQNSSVSYLDKLIINLKKILAKIPGGATRIATFAAALYLLRENQAHPGKILTEQFEDNFDHYLSEAYALFEEVASTNMSSGAVADKGGELMQKKKEKIKRVLPTFKEHITESLAKPDMLKRMRNMHVDPMAMKLVVRDPDRGEVDLRSIFTNAGWDYMGKGVAGVVFSKPGKNYVVKIFNTDDRGYKLWLAFCIANQGNPFVPKIYGKPTPINSELAAVRIERLIPSNGGAGTLAVGQLMYWYESGFYPEQWPQKFDPTLRKPLIKVMSFLDNSTDALDVHDGNVMFRGDQPVFVDPLNAMGDQSLERYETKFGRRSSAFLRSRFNPQDAIKAGAVIH